MQVGTLPASIGITETQMPLGLGRLGNMNFTVLVVPLPQPTHVTEDPSAIWSLQRGPVENA